MNKVIDVRVKATGVVLVGMADGKRGEFDVRPYMTSDFFRELENKAYFDQIRVSFMA